MRYSERFGRYREIVVPEWSRWESNPRPLECDHATPFQGFPFLEEISSVFDHSKPAVFLILANFITEDSDKIRTATNLNLPRLTPCWRLRFFVRLAIELLDSWLASMMKPGFSYCASAPVPRINLARWDEQNLFATLSVKPGRSKNMRLASWFYFSRKVYETDPLICPKCQGRNAHHRLH